VSQTALASSEYRASALAVWTALSAVYVIWGSTYLAIRFTVETTPPFLSGRRASSSRARFYISGAAPRAIQRRRRSSGAMP